MKLAVTQCRLMAGVGSLLLLLVANGLGGEAESRTTGVKLRHKLAKEAVDYRDLNAMAAATGIDYPVVVERALDGKRGAIFCCCGWRAMPRWMERGLRDTATQWFGSPGRLGTRRLARLREDWIGRRCCRFAMRFCLSMAGTVERRLQLRGAGGIFRRCGPFWRRQRVSKAERIKLVRLRSLRVMARRSRGRRGLIRGRDGHWCRRRLWRRCRARRCFYELGLVLELEFHGVCGSRTTRAFAPPGTQAGSMRRSKVTNFPPRFTARASR